MPEFDLAIRGGAVATAADTMRADVGIRDGRIVAVADRIEGAAREIDASGPPRPARRHRQPRRYRPALGPGIVMADDFASPTAAAAW